jgi:hypothetical protein
VGLVISLLYVELELELELELADVVKVFGNQSVGELPKGPEKECGNTSVIGPAMLLCR